jgi:hypothetical protein
MKNERNRKAVGPSLSQGGADADQVVSSVTRQPTDSAKQRKPQLFIGVSGAGPDGKSTTLILIRLDYSYAASRPTWPGFKRCGVSTRSRALEAAPADTELLELCLETEKDVQHMNAGVQKLEGGAK